MIFRQLFDSESSTYSYLLASGPGKPGILIDPVLEQVDRDLKLIKELDIDLIYAMNTHCHADHITGSGKIKTLNPKVKSIIAAASTAKADILIKNDDVISVGDLKIKVIGTPGHTNGCMSFYVESMGLVMTGDTMLIRGCGRTDFQGGSASQLYDSIHQKLFTLPDETLVYPAHDYKGMMFSTIGEEKRVNPRLTKTKDEFIKIMDNLGLPYPKKIDAAVPANLVCGI